MATAPFGVALETALKLDVQGGSLSVCKGPIKLPRFFCCISGTTVGVPKDPVAVLILDKTRACTNEMVTADMSHSWHPMTPAFSIQTYFLDWGDGQTSGPAVCPAGVCPGAVGHPLGGYVAPGIYTVTLTVTDNQAPAATAEDTVQVEVIDCIGPLGLGAFGACGASGVWFTENGGLSWQDRSGELSGVVVYDLEVNPFSLGGVALLYDDAGNPYVQGNGGIELWAATAAGLYQSKDGGGAWNEVDMALPAARSVAAVLCSLFDPLETYVLVHDAVATLAWLYRTVDGGLTWTNIQLGATCNYLADSAFGGSRYQMAMYQTNLYVIDLTTNNLYRRTLAGVWQGPLAGFPGPGVPVGLCSGSGYLWVVNGQDDLFRYSGAVWSGPYTSASGSAYENVIEIDGRIYCGAVAGNVEIYSSTGAFIGTLNATVHHGRYLAKVGSQLLTSDGPFLYRYEGDWTVGDWILEYTADSVPSSFGSIQEFRGQAWVADTTGHVLYRSPGGVWNESYLPSAVTDTFMVTAFSNRLFAPLKEGITWYIYERRGSWQKQGCGGTYNILRHGGDLLNCVCFPGTATTRIELSTTVTVPTDGRHHLLSMSSDGEFVYIGLLDSSANPVILRVRYDLDSVASVYEPGAGAWGGVKADHSMPHRVWAFGDFGAVAKCQYSDDYGDTWTDVTDAAWAGTDIVRPVLPSLYDSDDVFAVENIAAGIAQAWHSGDAGATWDGPHALDAAGIVAACGERDFVTPQSIFVGRVAAGANNIRFSPNNGASWVNRNAGFPANAPVTSIIVIA